MNNQEIVEAHKKYLIEQRKIEDERLKQNINACIQYIDELFTKEYFSESIIKNGYYNQYNPPNYFSNNSDIDDAINTHLKIKSDKFITYRYDYYSDLHSDKIRICADFKN